MTYPKTGEPNIGKGVQTVILNNVDQKMSENGICKVHLAQRGEGPEWQKYGKFMTFLGPLEGVAGHLPLRPL